MNGWVNSVKLSYNKYIMEGETSFGEGSDPITAEIHTGERVLENIKELLSTDRDWYSDMKSSHLEKADQNKKAWEEITARLPEKEREAFDVALARGLEDLYYTHYNAARRATESTDI